MPLIKAPSESSIVLPTDQHLTTSENHHNLATETIGMKGAGVNGVYVNGHKPLSSDADPLIGHAPAWTPLKKLKVVTVGAGFSGLIFAHKLQHQYPDVGAMVDHTIYEARHDVGGTWLVNTYPGIQCDVPAHIYVSTRYL